MSTEGEGSIPLSCPEEDLDQPSEDEEWPTSLYKLSKQASCGFGGERWPPCHWRLLTVGGGKIPERWLKEAWGREEGGVENLAPGCPPPRRNREGIWECFCIQNQCECRKSCSCPYGAYLLGDASVLAYLEGGREAPYVLRDYLRKYKSQLLKEIGNFIAGYLESYKIEMVDETVAG